MTDINWTTYPLISKYPPARAWLESYAHQDYAHNTVTSYGTGLENFLRFCSEMSLDPVLVKADYIDLYVRWLRDQHPLRGRHPSGQGLSIETRRLYTTAVRLFYNRLTEDGLVNRNPVRRGYYAPRNPMGGKRGLIPARRKSPWIPTQDEFMTILLEVKKESIRTQLMFAIAYDGGLRREELCLLETREFDPGLRTIKIRAETTKSRMERNVVYCEATSILYEQYLSIRRRLSTQRGLLFLSESPRNKAQPITFWTWSKVVRDIADRAGFPEFSTHTLRHLCLTELARAGWDVLDIAKYAGHAHPKTTLKYVHLGGRELALKFQNSMEQLHHWRVRVLSDLTTGVVE